MSFEKRTLGLFICICVVSCVGIIFGESSCPIQPIHADPTTGCQYLASETGYLVPRIDERGKQICNPPNKSLKN